MRALGDHWQNLADSIVRLRDRIRDRLTMQSAVPAALETTERERLIRRVLSTIHNNSILLRGEPGIGKASILLEIKRRLEERRDPTVDFFPVFIDLHGVAEDTLFATVGAAVEEQLARMPTLHRARESGVPNLGYGHRDLANDFRNVFLALKQRSTRPARLVLLVDGIDELNHYAPQTNQRVRSLFMAGLDGNLVMVATAVEIKRRWEQEGSPWYNFFEEIEFRGIDRVESRPR